MKRVLILRLPVLLLALGMTLLPLAGQGAAHPFSGQRHQTAASPDEASAEAGTSSWFTQAGQVFAGLQQKLQELLVASTRRIDEGSTLALAALLGFSLLYGMAHALGPGHGKTLAASWFIARPGKLTQALELGVYTGLVHGLVVLVLLAAAWLTESSLRSAQQNSGSLLQTLGAGGVMALGALLALTSLIGLIRGKDVSLHLHFHPRIGRHGEAGHQHVSLGDTVPETPGPACTCGHDHGHDHAHTHSGTGAPDDSPGTRPGTRRELLALALASSIIPCPASIMIMAFSVSLGLYLPGILSMAAMSLGVGIISAAAGLAALLVHRGGSRFLGFRLPGLLPLVRRSLRLLGGLIIVITGWALLVGTPS